jgi:hypothetical protein
VSDLPFATLFEPVVNPRENVRLIPINKFYVVEYIEPIYDQIIDLGTVNSGASSSLHEATELDLKQLEMGQWRLLILDDFELIIKQPRATERGTTKTQSTRVTPYTIFLDPELKSTEIYTFEDKNRVYLQAENKGQYDVYARVLAFGWKFMLEELTERPAKWTDIFVAVVTRATR